jgi:hypothetical protein
MAEVEGTGATQFEGVAITGDVAGMQFGGTADGPADGGDVAGGEQRGLFLEASEEDRILEERNLHGFDESVAQAAGIDVLNCLNIGDNAEHLEALKFGPGDGNLQYYLFNVGGGPNARASQRAGAKLF